MDIQVSGKNMELGEALQSHVLDKLTESVTKYFDRSAEAVVTFTKNKNLVECEMTTHLASGVFLAAHGEGGDAYGAFEQSLQKLDKRVRRYKRKLKNHHANGRAPIPGEIASYYLLQAPTDEDDNDSDELNPIVIAESQTTLRELTVGSAVMQLDLSEQPAVVFKNAAHGGINVVYRRRDGHIGWIDPTYPK